jgi:hypothetical protein
VLLNVLISALLVLHWRCIRRRRRNPRFGLRGCIGKALPSEAIAKGIRSCSVGKAETKVKSLGHLPAPAAVDRDAAFTVEGVELQESIAQALRPNCEFDQVREVLFVREADHLGLAANVTRHLVQSTLSSVTSKPPLASAARKPRSSIVTC